MSEGLLVDQPTVGAPAAQGIWRSTLQRLLRNYNAVAGGLFLSRLIDVKLAFPGILLAMAVVSVLGPSLYNLMIAVGIGWISGFSRLTRSQMLVAKAQDYVVAARAMGCSNTRVVR